MTPDAGRSEVLGSVGPGDVELNVMVRSSVHLGRLSALVGESKDSRQEINNDVKKLKNKKKNKNRN